MSSVATLTRSPVRAGDRWHSASRSVTSLASLGANSCRHVSGEFAPLEYLDDLTSGSVPSATVLHEEATLSGRDRTPLRIYLEAPAERWLTQIWPRVEEILALPENWDGYGGRSIIPSRMAAALLVLAAVMPDAAPAPTLVPCSDGGVQLEWHCGQVDLEVEVLSPNEVSVLFEDLRTGREWEEETSDLARIRGALQLVADREAGG